MPGQAAADARIVDGHGTGEGRRGYEMKRDSTGWARLKFVIQTFRQFLIAVGNVMTICRMVIA